MPQYSEEELNQHYNGNPAMPVDAVSVLQDPEERILIVKPNYKPGWALPGGCREEDEAPLDSLRREVKEEVSVHLEASQLKLAGVRYVAARNGRRAYVQLIFVGRLSAGQVEGIRLQQEELSDYAFVPKSELAAYAEAPRLQAIVAFLEAHDGNAAVYLENETVVMPDQAHRR